MNKKKPAKKKDGFELIEGTTGVILDSIWYNETEQILKINFANGLTLTHKPLENDTQTAVQTAARRNLG